MGETHKNRTILKVTGEDRESFLQGLVSNDVGGLSSLAYAAMLTPQGKYIADFFLAPQGDAVLIDVDDALAPALLQKLQMYRLRAKVSIDPTEKYAIRGLGAAPNDAWPDPRDPALGWRAYRDTPGDAPQIDWGAIRVAHAIPESGIELTPETYILEAGFERLHGVDFRKGCYVGQEVTARMKHKTELKKGLGKVRIKGAAPIGTEITAQGKPAGVLFTQSGEQAIAYLRFDRASGEMQAAEALLYADFPA